MKRKLSDEQVAEIRASKESSGVLAPRYGVCQARISEIRGGEARATKKLEAKRRWNAESPAALAGRRRRYEANPEIFRDYTLRSKYGITQAQCDEMAEKQGGVCAICQERKKLCVDHCHETGRVRGLLCMRCNTALGQLGDSVAGLRRFLEYLESRSS